MALHHLAVACVDNNFEAEPFQGVRPYRRNDSPGEPPWIQTGRAQRAGDLEANSTAGCRADYYWVGFFNGCNGLAFSDTRRARTDQSVSKKVTRFSLQKRAALLKQFASKSKDDVGFNVSVERLIALGLLSGLAWPDTGG
ncbi:hypothetical protein NKI88_04875 [Mesorhizobium sp. M0317]|uniref:hypothetical protein n=1 Tax=Mesorhizobium sp. M0317 TaxID=2956935 RepID=UPI00333966E7